jgi:hypothetical protein
MNFLRKNFLSSLLFLLKDSFRQGKTYQTVLQLAVIHIHNLEAWKKLLDKIPTTEKT